MKANKRVDDLGRAFAGSQLQVQLYVCCHEAALSRAIVSALGDGFDGAEVKWVAPLRKRNFAEPMDEAFLDALGLPFAAAALTTFWPPSGPRWDALATLSRGDGGESYLLVEAKSHVSEVFGNGCQAVEPSLRMITSSLERARQWFGAQPDSDWLGRLYQYANRLAHVYFFREILGKDAWLVNLLFADDKSTVPTSRHDWEAAIPGIKAELGFAGASVPYTIDVILPAGTREQLVAEANG